MRELDVFNIFRNQKAYAKAIEFVPYANYLGVSFQEHNGELVFRLPFSERLIGNPLLPALHGGALAGFMENAAMMHLLWETSPINTPKNIDFTIDFIRSGKPQDSFAVCSITKLGSRVANLQIEAWQSNRKSPIAIARSHFLLRKIE